MKKKTAGLASFALAGLLFVGGTFAYLQSETGTKTNTFVMGEGVSADITEPNWDGICFDGVVCPTTDLGKDAADGFYPGQIIAKDPQIKNTSTETAVYVAVGVKYGEGLTLADIEKFATIDFNTTDWTFNADKTVAYYKTELAAGEITKPVFNKLSIKESATTTGNAGEANVMRNFEIQVKGFVTQTEGVTGATNAQTALDIVFGNKLTTWI